MASPSYTVWCDMWPSWYRSDDLRLLSLYRTTLAPILSFIPEPSVNIFKSGSSWVMSLIASFLSGMIVIVRFGFQFVWCQTACIFSM